MFKRLWIIVFLSISLVVVGCAHQSPTPTPTPVSIVSPDAESFGFDAGVVASGTIVPAREARLSFAISGTIETVVVEVGDEVEEGDLLVQLDDTDARQAVAQAEMQKTIAELGVKQADVNLALAQANLKSVSGWSPNPNAVASAEAALANSEAVLEQAQAAYDQVAWMPGVSASQQSIQLEQATNSVNVAKANLDYLYSSRPDVSKARAQVDLADVALEQAKANLSLAGLSLEMAQHAEDKTALRAPFNGSVVSVEVTPGEVAMPGELVLVLADLDALRVETTDLSERDISQVEVGQTVIIDVEPLNVKVTGSVSQISPQATTLGGDVVYTVTIELDEQPSGLLWGMSVEVEIEVRTE